MIPIILAADGLPHEVELVAAAADAGMHIMRRPVDAAELLAAAACDRQMPVVLAVTLPRLSRDVVQRVLADGRLVIGLYLDSSAADRLREFGVVDVVDAGQSAERVIGAVAETLEVSMRSGADQPLSVPAATPNRGRLVAVWGPAGAPGRSVTSIGLSESFARRGFSTCTIDADLHAPALGLLLGIREDVSGLVVTCRQAEHGSLDERALRCAARAMTPDWSVLLGIGRPEQRSHVRAASVSALLAQSVDSFAVTVADLSATVPAENSDVLSECPDTAVGPVLTAADDLVVVTKADAIGVTRLLNVWQDLRTASPRARTWIVLTHAERSTTRAIQAALRRAGIGDPVHVIRRDVPAFSRCLARGATLGEVARRSGARRGYWALARAIIERSADGDPMSSAQ